MVTRKPVTSESAGQGQQSNQPPYPITPSTEVPTALPPPQRIESDDDDDDDEWNSPTDSEWDSGDDEKSKAEPQIPPTLQVGNGAAPRPSSEEPREVPATLRVGPPGGLPQRSQESLRSNNATISPDWEAVERVDQSAPQDAPKLQSQNPFLGLQQSDPSGTSQPVYGDENPADIWASVPRSSSNPFQAQQPPAAEAPIELASEESPVVVAPPQHAPPAPPAPPPPPPLAVPPPDTESPTSLQPPLIAVTPADTSPRGRQGSANSPLFNPGTDISALDAVSSRGRGLPDPNSPVQTQRTWQEQKEWEQGQRIKREQDAHAAAERAAYEEMQRRAEQDWFSGEAAEPAQPSTWNEQPPPQPPRPDQQREAPPPQPPRPPVQEEQPPPMPPRPVDGAEMLPPKPPRPQGPSPSSASASSSSQRKEFYAIKNIRWFDSTADQGRGKLRVSPILIQNLNGPCPLLALVNALVLSTPADESTSLVEVLRTREQVSLGLLLDAVFDELMSGRRGGAAQELPDVSELYTFLVTLHTGMNVNPRFVPHSASSPGADIAHAAEPLAEDPNIHPLFRHSISSSPLGSFESTREMKLYSTFNIPLIHGWLPALGTRVCAAFDRSAQTYEDAQNIQFHEEELLQKLSSSGSLSEQEQALFEDLSVIKDFLGRWPTQLTDTGLSIMAKRMRPGQIAILFRNDHFSTLYKEPSSGMLLTLVTDAGYASHEEVVWESLVDVNGRDSELFAGDFRVVGNMERHESGEIGRGKQPAAANPRPIRSMLDVDSNSDNDGWETVTNNRRRTNNDPALVNAQLSAGARPANDDTDEELGDTTAAMARQRTEQEDHDLALALQLQEEEEDRHRREQAQRQREQELSSQFLSQDSAGPQRGQPGRGAGTAHEVRPLIPPRRNGGATGSVPVTTSGTTGSTGATGGIGGRTAGEDGSGEAPPTYEQARHSRPYIPPADHPSSPLAPVVSPGVGRGTGMTAYGQQSSGVYGHSQGSGMGSSMGMGSRVGRRASHGRPGREDDRMEKCVVM